jgi:hypothetical protein
MAPENRAAGAEEHPVVAVSMGDRRGLPLA